MKSSDISIVPHKEIKNSDGYRLTVIEFNDSKAKITNNYTTKEKYYPSPNNRNDKLIKEEITATESKFVYSVQLDKPMSRGEIRGRILYDSEFRNRIKDELRDIHWNDLINTILQW